MDGSMADPSVLTEATSDLDKNSRRAMILQMAKSRMKHGNGEQMGAASPMSQQWTENPFPSLSEAQTESTDGDNTFDIAGDLD